MKKSYPTRYPHNGDSIGIEVVGKYSEDNKIWELVTEAQVTAIKSLLACLLISFGLDKQNDIYIHEAISYKTASEGKTVLDSISE